MVAAPATLSTDSHNSGLRAIFWGGLIAGTLDITYAIVFSYLRSGTSPVVILQSVASGLLGAGSYNGGVATAPPRPFFHLLLSFPAAPPYYPPRPQLPGLLRAGILRGPGFAGPFFAGL